MLRTPQEFPFAPRKIYPAEYVRQFPHLRPKTSVQSSVLRLSGCVTDTLHRTLVLHPKVHLSFKLTDVISNSEIKNRFPARFTME